MVTIVAIKSFGLNTIFIPIPLVHVGNMRETNVTIVSQCCLGLKIILFIIYDYLLYMILNVKKKTLETA